MREIKFRVWYSDRKSSFYIYGSQALRLMGYFGQEGYSFEQYTGLKDKNGVEIYEGDVVKTFGFNPYTVEFFDGLFNPVSSLESSEWEVIGNIHENAGLLED